MSTDYNYDDQGQFFPFFILTIAGLVTFPLTYSLLKPSKDLESTAPRIKTDFKAKDDDLIQGQKKKQWRKERRIKRFITVVLGYFVMAWMIYLIMVTQRLTPKIWDPYDILDISRSASEKAIKKQYRKLTLQYHPDKVKINEALNETMEDATAHYVEIAKAYKALTDDEVRNNYIQFGHPDGKQSFSIGIALPTFIVTEGNGKYVLLLYGLLLGVLLPYIVGKWWYGTQKLTKEKVLINSAGRLFREWKEDITQGGVIGALSCGDEYQGILKGNKAESGLDRIESRIVPAKVGAERSSSSQMAPKDQAKLQELEGLRRKTLALLWAYLTRTKLDDPILDDEKYEVAPQALVLNEAFVAVCLAYGNLNPLLNSLRAAQNIIQAIPPNASMLMQLPHITEHVARNIEGEDHMTIQQFMDLPEYARRKLSTDKNHNTPGLTLSPQQYNEAVAVARQIPFLHVEKAFFKCLGEKYIVTGSLVQFVVKARVIPPGTANVPEVTATDLEDIDPDDGDLDVLMGRKPAKSSKPGGTTRNDKEEAPPLAFAPYFPRDHPPRWHLFLSENRQGRIAVPPASFATFNKPIYADSGKPTFNVQTLKLQFQAPPSAGSYTFGMNLICDSYIGMDSKQEVTLVVEDTKKAVEIESEEEISEPDEDSIAGQMNALKTGGITGAPAPKKRRTAGKPAIAEEEDDDESDTEGEAGDGTSDTDTDTDTDEE